MLNDAYREQLNKTVRLTLDSGVKPIETFLEPIFDCYDATAIAYRCVVKVNSLVSGVLTPDDYIDGAVDDVVAIEFALRSIVKALAVKNSLEGANVSCKRLFVRVPSSVIYADGIYERLRVLLAENGVDGKSSKICLEFASSVMDAEETKLAEVFSDIRATGLKIAVDGYLSSDFAFGKLLSSCPDFLFTDRRAVALATDREKRAAFALLINFAKGLGGEIIACGISGDEQLREFKARECIGFMPDGRYSGAFDIDGAVAPISEVLARGGSND